MVAYQFPPVGGSGVQRSAKFAKYLPLFDWEPVVLTRDTNKMTLRDESLQKEIPSKTEIIRTPAYDLTVMPSILSKVGKFIAWKLLIPDGEVLWMRTALKACLDRVEKGDIKALYTTSYPYSDHIIGLEVKKRFPELLWLADFRDEWTNNPYLLDKPHPAYRMKKEKVMENDVLTKADVLITNTPVMKDNFVRLNPGLNLEERMTVIPNGYDSEDFISNGHVESPNDRFTITYTGALYGRRKPDIILESIGNLVRSEMVEKNKIRVRFIGSFKNDVLQALVEKNGITGCVEAFSYMAHDECLKNMLSSDAMLLIEGGGPGSEAFYTGKIFEYIQTGKPVLAVIPEKGAAAGIIRDTRTGLVCHWSDVKSIEKGFLALYKAWQNSEKIIDPDYDEIARYDRKALTKSLAELLNRSL
jgi:glycosyltransferase involved in cell wall biosynthesis